MIFQCPRKPEKIVFIAKCTHIQFCFFMDCSINT
nr:MAG TPA: hypothetical protein [Caudoviricetes sp.]